MRGKYNIRRRRRYILREEIIIFGGEDITFSARRILYSAGNLLRLYAKRILQIVRKEWQFPNITMIQEKCLIKQKKRILYITYLYDPGTMWYYNYSHYHKFCKHYFLALFFLCLFAAQIRLSFLFFWYSLLFSTSRLCICAVKGSDPVMPAV